MDQKQLTELYEKLIQGSSNTCQLLDTRKLASTKKKFTPSQLASIRFSDEYLELLIDQKSFQATSDALTYFYTKQNIRSSQKCQTLDYYEFLFEHIFSHSEKILLDQMVRSQFNKNGNQSSTNPNFSSQKILHEIKMSQNEKKGIKLNEQIQNQSQKHIFLELLESLMWNEETMEEKKAVKKKETTNLQKEKDDSAFSIVKMMSMLI